MGDVGLPRQELAIPEMDGACPEATLAQGVYAYRRYGSGAPALWQFDGLDTAGLVEKALALSAYERPRGSSSS